VTALEQGKISSEEFGVKWAELWGYAGDEPFAEMRDKVFTACDFFIEDSEDPTIKAQPYELDEKQFLTYVKDTLAAYEMQMSSD